MQPPKPPLPHLLRLFTSPSPSSPPPSTSTTSTPKHRTRTTLIHSDIYPSQWLPPLPPSNTGLPPVIRRSSRAMRDNLLNSSQQGLVRERDSGGGAKGGDPFWNTFIPSGERQSYMRLRTHQPVAPSPAVASQTKTQTEAKRVGLIFAGLGSYPHLPSSHPTPSSLRIWSHASTALLTPSPALAYEPSNLSSIVPHDSPVRRGEGTLEEQGWLRKWVQDGKSLGELMKRPDLTGGFVLASSVALLATAQENLSSPTLLPSQTTHVTGHGLIGTLTALVVTGRLSLPCAVRLARLLVTLPPPSSPGGKGFMTTLLTISPTPDSQRLGSLSEPLSESETMLGLGAGGEGQAPLRRVLEIIRGLQVEEGWDKSLLGKQGENGDDEEGGMGEWAGESLINSDRMVVVSGTKSAVIKIIDRLRAGGLATPVMDLHLPAPFHTPLMRHAIHQFRAHLKGCTFYEEGGAPPEGWLGGVGGMGVKGVTIVDGMTGLPLNTNDIPSALLAQLTRPLKWADTTRYMVSCVDEIRTVGKGTRGLGVQIERDMRGWEGVRRVGVREFGVDG